MPEQTRRRCTYFKRFRCWLAARIGCCCPRRKRICEELDQSVQCYAMVERMMSSPSTAVSRAMAHTLTGSRRIRCRPDVLTPRYREAGLSEPRLELMRTGRSVRTGRQCPKPCRRCEAYFEAWSQRTEDWEPMRAVACSPVHKAWIDAFASSTTMPMLPPLKPCVPATAISGLTARLPLLLRHH